MRKNTIKKLVNTFEMLKKNKRSLSTIVQMLSPEAIDSILECIYNIVYNDRFRTKIMKYREYKLLRKRMSANKKIWMELLTKNHNTNKKKRYMVGQKGGSSVLQTILSLIPTLLAVIL